MSGKALRGWMVVALALVALAWWLTYSRERQRRPDMLAGAPLLRFDVNDVAAIRIRAGTNAVDVVRKEGRWRLESLYGYPADPSRVVDRLMELSELKVGQVVPGAEADLAEFGLDEKSATSVVFEASDGRSLGRLLLGKSRQGRDAGGWGGFPDGQYVRVDEGPVVVLARNIWGFGGEARDWIPTDLLNVSPGKGDLVEVTTAEGTYRVRVEDVGKFVLEDLGEDERLDDNVARRVTGALQYLTFQTIEDPAKTDEELGFNEPSIYVYKKADGTVYRLTIGKQHVGGGRYVRVAVSYAGAPAVGDAVQPSALELPQSSGPAVEMAAEEVKSDSTEEKEAVTAAAGTSQDEEQQGKKEDAAKLEQRAREEHERLSPWTFVVSSWSAESLTLPRSKLVLPVEKKEPSAAESENAESGPEAETTAGPAAE